MIIFNRCNLERHSKSHATSIGLIRNLRTGFVSPQFHVMYDELFQTTYSEDDVDLNDPIWAELMETARVRDFLTGG